jgi:hypothetical protein
MENTTDIRGRLEEIGLSEDQINDVLPLLTREASPEKEVPLSVQELRDKMDAEEDYTKRAALAAKIISLSLDSTY